MKRVSWFKRGLMIRPEIQSSRIVLRCLSDTDVTETYLGWLHDSSVNQFLELRFAPPGTLSALRKFIKKVNQSDDELLFGIFLREGPTHIGNIKLGPINFPHSRAHIGIMIGEKSYWGRGLATEAIVLLSGLATSGLGLSRIYAGCYESNVGSRRAFERAGFSLEARLADFWESPDGSCEHELIFRLQTGVDD